MKVLVVEDEPIIRMGLVSLMEDLGLQVLEAGHSDEAIALLERESDVAVVVTDVDMPGTMDGIKLSHYVRNRWPPIHLLVVSGKAGVDVAGLPEGARFFTKPYREEVLAAALLELGARGFSR